MGSWMAAGRGESLPGPVGWKGINVLGTGVLAWSLFFSGSAPYQIPPNGSFVDYPEIGAALLHGTASPASPVSSRMPLSPVAAHLLTHGGGTLSRRLRQTLPLAATALLAFCLGTLLLSPLCGAVSFLGFLTVIFAGGTLIQHAYSALVTLVACFLAWEARRPSLRGRALLACALGASIMFRSPLAFFPPILALYELVFVHRGRLRSCWRSLAILCTVPYLFIIPTLMMNWALVGRVIPFETNPSDNNIITGAVGLVPTMAGDLSVLTEDPPLSGESGAALSWAFAEISRHPFRYAASCVKRVFFVLSLNPILYLIGLYSMWALGRREEFRRLALLTGYFIAAHCLMSVREDYFVPLRPLLAALAAAGLSWAASGPAARGPDRASRWASRFAHGALGLVLAVSAYSAFVAFRYAARAARRPPESREALEEALRASPEDPWLIHQRGHERLRAERIAEAVADYSKALRQRPDDPDWRLDLAIAESFRGGIQPIVIYRPGWGPGDFSSDALEYLLAKYRISRFFALSRIGRKEAARQEVFSAWRGWAYGCNDVHGPRTAETEEVVATLRSASVGPFLDQASVRWPHLLTPERRIAFMDALLAVFPDDDRLILARAESAIERGQNAAALRLLNGAKGTGLPLPERQRLGRLLGEAGDHRRALRELTDLTRRFPENAALRLDLADEALKAGDRKTVADSLVRLEDLKIDDSLWLRLGWLYGELKDHPRAMRALEMAIRIRPEDPAPWADRAGHAARAGERRTALESLLRMEKLDPSPALLRRAAALYEELGDHRGAMRTLGPALARSPGDAALWRDRAEYATRAGERGFAREALLRLEKLAPSPELLRRAAALYGELDDHRGAVRTLGLVLARSPKDAPLWCDLAEHAARAGERAAALESLRRMERLDPSPALLRRAARLHGELGGYSRALAILDGLLRRSPGDPELRLEKAVAAGRSGDHKTALDLLRRLRSAVPPPADPIPIALAYQDLGEFALAVAVLDPLTRGSQATAAAWELKGTCEYLAGSPETAIADINAALAKDADLMSAYLSLGGIYAAQGRRADALKTYERGLRAAPHAGSPDLRPLLLKARDELSADQPTAFPNRFFP